MKSRPKVSGDSESLRIRLTAHVQPGRPDLASRIDSHTASQERCSRIRRATSQDCVESKHCEDQEIQHSFNRKPVSPGPPTTSCDQVLVLAASNASGDLAQMVLFATSILQPQFHEATIFRRVSVAHCSWRQTLSFLSISGDVAQMVPIRFELSSQGM